MKGRNGKGWIYDKKESNHSKYNDDKRLQNNSRDLKNRRNLEYSDGIDVQINGITS